MSQINILLVEDDVADQMSFKRFIKYQQLPYGYQIASSVAEAVDMLGFIKFDLVLADHSLGDGTAFDLFEHIPVTTPIVFVTGHGDEDIAVRAMKMGASDYLTKDLNGDYLKLLPTTINNIIKSKTVEKELEVYKQLLEEMVEVRTAQLQQEINERLRAERRLLEEKERAQVTLKSIGDAVITTDVHGVIEFVNPVAEHLTGWRYEEARGQPIERVFKIVYEKSRKQAANPVYECIKNDKIVAINEEMMLLNRLGEEYCILDSAAPIHNASAELQGVVLVFSDVTQTRKLSRELAHQALHDPLTGLVNRHVFEQRLNRVLESFQHSGGTHVFCYLDLDQFKVINDACGHAAGDDLLKQVTCLLRSRVRVRDTIGRLGGDEFGILMEHCSMERAEDFANSLREQIADFRFNWFDKTFRIGVSIGLIEISAEFSSLNDLLMMADATCHAAKDAGRNRVHIYHDTDESIKLRSGEIQWVEKLNKALDERQFKLYKQPLKNILSNDGGEHYEILVRIESEGGKIVPPGAFIPAAERYGLMPKIDQYIIDNTLAFFADNRSHLERLGVCSLNLSGHTLSSEWLLDFIVQTIDYYRLPADKFCFEITETAAVSNLNMVSGFMRKLQKQGYLFALDDFGSGLSSFAYLKNLPVDFLKIDGMFVKDICTDAVDFAMVKSINEIGHLMHKKTVAEYVESEAIYHKLVEIGVDFAQGYWIKHPYPLEQE